MLLHLTIGVSLQLAEASSNNATVDCCRNFCIVSANVIRFFRFLFYYSMHFITVSFITAFGVGMCTSTRLIDYSNASAGSSMKMMIDWLKKIFFFFFFFLLLSLFLIGYAGIWAVV